MYRNGREQWDRAGDGDWQDGRSIVMCVGIPTRADQSYRSLYGTESLTIFGDKYDQRSS